MAKGFDQIHFDKALNIQQIQATNAILDDLKRRKRKKVQIDHNKTFANITSIQAAQEEEQRLQKL